MSVGFHKRLINDQLLASVQDYSSSTFSSLQDQSRSEHIAPSRRECVLGQALWCLEWPVRVWHRLSPCPSPGGLLLPLPALPQFLRPLAHEIEPGQGRGCASCPRPPFW